MYRMNWGGGFNYKNCDILPFLLELDLKLHIALQVVELVLHSNVGVPWAAQGTPSFEPLLTVCPYFCASPFECTGLLTMAVYCTHSRDMNKRGILDPWTRESCVKL